MNTRHGLEIRAATGAEAPGLSELLASVGLVVPPPVLAERLEALRRAEGAVLLALEWGPPSGVVVLHWFRSLAADQPIARITTLLVGVEERRRGIGRLLVKAASQAARVAGCDVLELADVAGAADLRAFCLATGFIETASGFVRGLRKKG